MTLTQERIGKLKSHYSERKVNYISAVLTEEEVNIIEGNPNFQPEDFLIIARVNRMIRDKTSRAKSYDSYRAKDFHHYMGLEEEWLKQEEVLLGKSLHKHPTSRELFEDFSSHDNGLRFKIFYCLKFRDKVEKPRVL
ncbi:hypothetical protein HYV50_00590 [Candidatus Pacearchaeota archaeon]|nr:hypothetical protein [Candidatus Pacearchaeota archaeon]